MKDSFNREITYLRLSVTDLCNLRCRYCMPEEGICKLRHEDILTEDEMIGAVETASSLGIGKLRITGGEPLVKKNILSICERAAAIPGIREVCLTTNAIHLKRLAEGLRKAGIDRLNISLDTLSPEKYRYMTRGGNLQKALDGIEAALRAGFRKIKINTVLIGGFNDDEIRSLAELTRRWPVDVRFIELMPMPGQHVFSAEAFVPDTKVQQELDELVPVPQDGGVARLWKLPDARGNVGLISPVFNEFCARCNRIRLTADGKLKPCLHAAAEYPIKGLPPQQVREQFIRAINGKPRRHALLSPAEGSQAERSMNRIGG